MTPALRWEAMRAVKLVSLTQWLWGTKSVTRQCPQTTTFLKRKESGEVESNRDPFAYRPNALPLGQTGSWAETNHSLFSCSLQTAACTHDDDVELHQCLRMSVDILRTNCDQRVRMVQCCFTSTETTRLIRTESPGRPPRLSRRSWTLPAPTYVGNVCIGTWL